MKTRIISQNRKGILTALLSVILIGGAAFSASAQSNSANAPIGAPNGIGWNPGPQVGNNQNNSAPAPSNTPNFNAPNGNGFNGNNPNGWGNPGNGPMGPNGIGWNPGPMMVSNPMNNVFGPAPVVVSQPVIPNQGVTKVIACGYDAEGIWRVLPLQVAYQYNGVQYNVNVLNAWNPWTDQWNTDVDQPAYNTNYYLNGVTYDFYAPLSTGTYYFNL